MAGWLTITTRGARWLALVVAIAFTCSCARSPSGVTWTPDHFVSVERASSPCADRCAEAYQPIDFERGQADLAKCLSSCPGAMRVDGAQCSADPARKTVCGTVFVATETPYTPWMIFMAIAIVAGGTVLLVTRPDELPDRRCKNPFGCQ